MCGVNGQDISYSGGDLSWKGYDGGFPRLVIVFSCSVCLLYGCVHFIKFIELYIYHCVIITMYIIHCKSLLI